MTERDSGFELPSRIDKRDGSPRRVGVEIEFSGITLDETAAALRSALGGELGAETAAERLVKVESLGEFAIELDWAFLKRTAARNVGEDASPEWVERLSQAAAVLVPVEVVCPPIPMDRLAVLEPMVGALRQAGAIGTEESLVAAYGVHLNPEAPALDAQTLLDYVKAFSLLQWWLVDALEVDAARKVSPYVDLYPEAYLKQVVSRSEATLDAIFSDYLSHNATRNRALDLLPLLAQIDEQRVRRVLDDPRIKARPTFHYRLPNCHIERPGWSLAESWASWMVVERVAERPGALDELSKAFLAADRPLLGVSRKDWVKYMDRWLKDHALA